MLSRWDYVKLELGTHICTCDYENFLIKNKMYEIILDMRDGLDPLYIMFDESGKRCFHFPLNEFSFRKGKFTLLDRTFVFETHLISREDWLKSRADWRENQINEILND